jgi:hypothetical protein
MQYKTIILELLQQNPRTHDRLRKSRTLMQTLDLYSGLLKTSHEAWKARLARAKPGSHPSQIASEALELALAELEASLPAESTPNEGDAVSPHTPPA